LWRENLSWYVNFTGDPTVPAPEVEFPRCCPSPLWDEICPILSEDDVPLPKAAEVIAGAQDMTLSQLQEWLESRGLVKRGTKDELVTRYVLS